MERKLIEKKYIIQIIIEIDDKISSEICAKSAFK